MSCQCVECVGYQHEQEIIMQIHNVSFTYGSYEIEVRGIIRETAQSAIDFAWWVLKHDNNLQLKGVQSEEYNGIQSKHVTHHPV